MFKKSNQRTPFWQKREEGSDRGGDRGFGRGSDRGPRMEMHPATCAECGESCEVPFKPTGSRPVLCRDCFKGSQGESRPSRSSGGDRSFGGDRSSGGDRSFEDRKMYKTQCATCREECSVPFQPKPGRAIYCRDCMGKNEGGRDFRAPREERRGGETKGWSLTKDQFEMLNNKMDKVLKLLQVAQPNIVAFVKKEESSLKEVAKKEIAKKEVLVKKEEPMKKEMVKKEIVKKEPVKVEKKPIKILKDKPVLAKAVKTPVVKAKVTKAPAKKPKAKAVRKKA
ncbi:MAG: CxxC-x17-CxxC domain-containing protein [Candidatus Gracilibacteria bacterium]